ncbi:LOW QUALITY PROTEIN: PHD finger protein MALE MEIOCYTE DEATH 1-like [Salvia miltiorrhiza]|uniref:LOW QUALITY PROTEIN: PHD finger protein MALE MEIOCYTE DEATH 1-like n=1 Tax=Salvia miltiorrhiza TaxID=226208 RepID=UPI0025ABE91B|nr:LOW QUALITY PROTEIN: PHD finger protein MALE MEIOCYTE DEATH 1-like [Salvia miltiorrhiza]
MNSPVVEFHSKNPPKFYGFHTFAEPGCPITLTGAFRDNIRRFLQECAAIEDYDLGGMPIWRTFLVYESKGTVLPLYTVEEKVADSDRPFCDYCRCVGWSHHFVSKRKYHLIIPANDEWDDPIDESVFDLQTHLLHGLIHCNGFGHLICINGIEGGSKFICGREIMDLWDRICTTLSVRQITVEDLSKKHEMELRLLHGVAYGRSWFGKWGYQFCHGSFGVKEHNYGSAIDLLSSLDLDRIIQDFSFVKACFDLKQMIEYYRNMSGNNLATVRGLFRFMFTVKSTTPTTRYSTIVASWPEKKKVIFSTHIRKCSSKFPTKLAPTTSFFRKEKPTKCRKFSNLAAKMDSRWPVRRLEHVAEVIAEALKEKRAAKNTGSCGMTRQEARDAARLHIGDTGLIDHVLKAMNNVIVGDHIVRRAVNRATKVLEYTIQDLKCNDEKQFYPSKVVKPSWTCCLGPGRSVYNDVAYLYKNVLLGYPECESVESAAQMILHSKHFVKEFPFRDEDAESLMFICKLILSSVDLKADLSYEFTAVEHVDVPLYATVGDLKMAVENAFRDTYCMLEKLQVTEILELEEVEDEEVLFGIVQSGMELHVKGCGTDMESNLRYEGGIENWTVKCKCGARDDDGERMVACDICEAWQHTHCCGIEEAEAVPRLFVCETCCTSLVTMQRPCGLTYGYESCEGSLLKSHLREVGSSVICVEFYVHVQL